MPCSGKAVRCQLLLSLFVLCCSKVPSIALTFAVSQSGIDTELGLATLEY